jgi:hypothetical protein
VRGGQEKDDVMPGQFVFTEPIKKGHTYDCREEKADRGNHRGAQRLQQDPDPRMQ